MTLVGVWINGLAIVAAGLLGSRCKQGLPERIKERLMAALALCLLYIGIGGINADMNLMVLTISVTTGALIGEWLEIEYRMGEACRWLQRMGRRVFGQKETGDDTDGFVVSTLIVCAGAMSIVGGIESGTQGSYTTYLVKSCMDFVVIFMLASTKGSSCALAGISVFVYQLLITVSAGYIAQIVTPAIITEMAEIGALLILAIAMNLLHITKLSVGNLIVAPYIPIVLYLLHMWQS